jgi:hypothetical protein
VSSHNFSNFSVVIKVPSAPWPFSWGPFHKDRTYHVESDYLEILVAQIGLLDPLTLECYTSRSKEECVVTVDFRGATRLKRRSSILNNVVVK